MAGKPDTHGRFPCRTRSARDKLIRGIREMFAWVGPQARRMSLLEAFQEHYVKFANLKPKTIARYRCEIRRFEDATGCPRLGDITSETFLNFRQRCLAEDLRPASIEGSVKIVRCLLRFAHESGWISELPKSGKPLRIIPPCPEPATLEEIDNLYQFAAHASRPSRGNVAPADWWRAFLCIELWTGLRIEDLRRRFHWEHIQEDRIMFRAAKTERLHIFPRHPVVDAHLELVRDWSDSYVLGRCGGPQCMGNTVRSEMAFLCEEAGIRRLTPQQFREACVTNWLAAGETAGRLVHGAGLTIAERHYAGRLELLREAMPRFRWPPSMLKILPPELRVVDEGAA